MKKQAAAVFEKLLSAYDRHHSIGDITPTFCRLFGVTEPECCGAQAIAPVVDHAAKIFGGEGKTERALLFCTDAMGDHQRELFPAKQHQTCRQRLQRHRCGTGGQRYKYGHFYKT